MTLSDDNVAGRQRYFKKYHHYLIGETLSSFPLSCLHNPFGLKKLGKDLSEVVADEIKNFQQCSLMGWDPTARKRAGKSVDK